jgi:hypothetical protein
VGLIRVESPVEVLMPDGTAVWVRLAGEPAGIRPGTGNANGNGQVDEFGGETGVDVSRRSGDAKGTGPARVENFVETVRSVAASVHEAVADAKPTAVSVEFGLELSAESSAVVAVLAHIGAKTSITVRLEWDRLALREANKTAPVPTAVPTAPTAPTAEPEPEPAAGQAESA